MWIELVPVKKWKVKRKCFYNLLLLLRLYVLSVLDCDYITSCETNEQIYMDEMEKCYILQR